MEDSDKKLFVSFKQAARMLGVTAERLRVARDEGQVHMVFLGRRWMVNRQDIEGLLRDKNEK
jgi:Helix-turn-helix domain